MKKILVTLSVSLVVVLTTFGVVQAAKDTTAGLEAGATHRGLFARSADKVVVAGDVDGDVWVAGSEIEITGNINGNIYAAGERVKVSGNVTGSIHAAGSEVDLDGVVEGSVYAAGSRVDTADSFRSGHAAALAGSEVMIRGQISDQLYAAGSRVTLAGSVGQSARIQATTITVTSAGSIAGDLKYASETQPSIANDRAIQGKVVQDVSVKKTVDSNQTQARVASILVGLAWNIVLAAVLLAIIPSTFKSTYQAFNASPLRHSLKGLGFVILVPIGLIFGFVTIVGIPVMVLALMAYIAVILVAPVAISYYLGQQLGARTKVPVGHSNSYGQLLLATVVGLVIFTIVTIIPVIGGLLGSLLYLAGIGMVISHGFPGVTSRSVSKTPAKKARAA